MRGKGKFIYYLFFIFLFLFLDEWTDGGTFGGLNGRAYGGYVGAMDVLCNDEPVNIFGTDGQDTQQRRHTCRPQRNATQRWLLSQVLGHRQHKSVVFVVIVVNVFLTVSLLSISS